jgi:hypothetical protein
MSQLSPAPAGWTDLTRELDCWLRAEQVATLWWRDDDAVAPTKALDRLISVANEVPIALAVIPGPAEPGLAIWLAERSHSAPGADVAILQHGWRHLNHTIGGKKSEFSAKRRRDDVAFEVAAGKARLKELFGSRALPIFVPPWNRLDDQFLPALRDCGIRAISRMKPRQARQPIPGFIEVSVHIDLTAWTSPRAFIGEGAALGGLVEHLRARRRGTACGPEPTGILTHHLIQDEATEAFLLQLLATTGGHPAARWLGATEVFYPVAAAA